MTPEMQVPAATRDCFVSYDELAGPDLDAARWGPARLPLPTGAEHIPLDPDAELVVGEGEVRVTIPRFSLSHDEFQSVDSPKYLGFSTRRFELPRDLPATILSRVQRFDFRPITSDALTATLERILKEEGVPYAPGALPRSRPLILDARGDARWLEGLRGLGFRALRPLTRMYLGAPPRAARPELEPAILGPEFG